MQRSSLLELVLRWITGVSFIYASIHKIAAPAAFAKIIYGYYLFPDASINLIAVILPFVELAAGMALILGIYPRSAGLIVCTLLTLFSLAVSVNLLRGHQFDCGCFAFNREGISSSAKAVLVRNSVYFLFSLQIMLFDSRRRWCLLQTGNFCKNRTFKP